MSAPPAENMSLTASPPATGTALAGTVTALFVSPAAGEPMVAQSMVRAVAGKGLVGDRYFNGHGTFNARHVSGREVTDLTLVELEVIELLQARGIALKPASTRRNIVTRDVALNHLTGRRFMVGHVELLGVNLCEPCAALFAPEERRDALRGLAHKGGLRAKILSDGVIRLADAVQLEPRGGRARARPASRQSTPTGLSARSRGAGPHGAA